MECGCYVVLKIELIMSYPISSFIHFYSPPIVLPMNVIHRGSVCLLKGYRASHLVVALDHYNNDTTTRVVLDQYGNVLTVPVDHLTVHPEFYNDAKNPLAMFNNVSSALSELSNDLRTESPYDFNCI